MPITDFVTNDLERYRAFANEFRTESDRGCAVLVMCVMEDSLRRLISRIVTDPDDKLRNLAPPGRLSVGIETAVLLGALSNREAATFRDLSKIRNEFAHRAMQSLTFNEAPIAGRCKALQMPITDDAHRAVGVDAAPVDNRTRFLMASAMLQIAISVRTDHAKRLKPAQDV